MHNEEKVAGGGNDASLTSTTEKILELEQREKDSVDSQVNRNHESKLNHDSNFEAEVVDNAIANAIPSEGVFKKGLILRYTLITIVSMVLLIAIIIPSVFLTRKSQKDLSASENAFLEKLKPLLTIASREELERPDSSQSSALEWLFRNPNFSEYSFDRQVQRFGMAVLFFSTKGKLWEENRGWLTDDDECTWYQVREESVCVNGTIQVLSLYDNNLDGLLPNDIALLSSLTYLHFSDNSLSGSIPSEIGQCKGLHGLSLSSVSLGGSVPTEIGALTNLESLYLYYHSFDGSIPSEIGQCTKLTTLSLRQNSFDGSIPSEIGQCTKLSLLDLALNSLDGSIPSEIGQCKNITWLNLSSNSLIGSIPSEIGALTNLADFYLSNTNLHGTIPESLCNQGSLVYVVDQNVDCSCC